MWVGYKSKHLGNGNENENGQATEEMDALKKDERRETDWEKQDTKHDFPSRDE